MALASLKMSFMGRKAPGPAGGVALAAGAAGVGLPAGAGVAAGLLGGTAGDCALTVVQVIKLKQAAESHVRLKAFDFSASRAMRFPN